MSDQLGELELFDDDVRWEIDDEVGELLEGEVRRLLGELLTKKALDELTSVATRDEVRALADRVNVIVNLCVKDLLEDCCWSFDVIEEVNDVSLVSVFFSAVDAVKTVELGALMKAAAHKPSERVLLAQHLRAIADDLEKASG